MGPARGRGRPPADHRRRRPCCWSRRSSAWRRAAAMRDRLAAAIAARGVQPRRLRAARRLGGGRRDRPGPGSRGDRPVREPGRSSPGPRAVAGPPRPRWRWPSSSADLAVANAAAGHRHSAGGLRARVRGRSGHPRGRTRRPQPRARSGSSGCPPGSRSAGPTPRRRDRLRELVDWEIDTLQPGFGWLHGINYVFVDESETGAPTSVGCSGRRPGRSMPGLAAALGVEPGRRVLYHPRGAFDLWGARYFIIPSYPGDWTRDESQLRRVPRSRPT